MSQSRPCEVCMKPIEPERMEAIPETRLCVEHANAIKKHGGEFILRSSQVRTSKPGSLKINYGGVNAKLRRNQAGIEKLKDEFEEAKWQAKETPPS